MLALLELNKTTRTTTTTTPSSFNNNKTTTANALYRRLYLGLATASFWTAAAIYWCPTFSVGYDLFSSNQILLYSSTAVHFLTGCFSSVQWKKKKTNGNGCTIPNVVRGCIGSMFSLLNPTTNNDDIDNPNNVNNKNDAVLYAAGTLGLIALALMPQLVAFPTATIPSLLGKRLSRAASGWTFLGSVVSYCLYKHEREQESGGDNRSNDNKTIYTTLRRGLGVGALLHIGLVMAKVIGVDGGGLLVPGKGLWQDYPSFVNASGSSIVLMTATYSLLAFVCLFGK